MKTRNLNTIKSTSLFFRWMFGTLALAFTIAQASAFDNSDLNLRNSFHWGPRQYEALSTTNLSLLTSNDFRKAHLQHWLASTNSAVGSTLSLERESSPDSAGTIEGQKTWYDYAGKTNSEYEGTQILPLYVARVLPDGTTGFSRTDRNVLGNVVTNISTYTAGGSVAFRTNYYAYAANGIDLIAVTNALGVQISSNSFNAYHEILTNFNALNEKTVFTYNANQQPLTVTLPTGQVTTNVYGASNLLTSGITVGFATNSYTWTNDLVLTHTDPRGLITTNAWDALNRPTGTTFPDGSSISNIYTILDLTATKDRMGNWTHLGYDNMRRNTSITNALGNVTTFTYCSCGALESIADALTDLTTYEYDNQGNPTNVTYADNYSVTATYNLLHQVVSTIDSGGTSVTNAFNNQGLVIAVSNALGRVQGAVYDVLDRATNTVNANGVTVSTAFDNLNRPLARSYPDGGIENWAYTPNFAGATSHTNQITNIVTYAFDTLNRKTNEVYVGVTTNGFSYDGANDLLTVTDGKNQTTHWNFDQYGNSTNKVDAAGNIVLANTFDANNRLATRWSIAKGTTTYHYDSFGNVTSIVYPTSPTITLQYDVLNRLTNMVDAVGTIKYAWDAVGQLLSEDGPWSNDTMGYTYANRLRTGLSLTQSNASPWSQSYGYDISRRLTNLTSQAGSFGYAYDAVRQMQVARLTLPNGAYNTNTFDSVARLLSTKLLNSSAAVLDAESYGYNLAGQRFTETNTAGDYRNYVYDNIGELTRAIGNEAGGVTNRWQEQFGYAYDAAGNLNQRTNNTLIQTFNVNNLNELTTVTNTGALTVAGTTTSPATNVTVNTSNAVLYADTTFASTNQPWVNGNNTFTAIAKDVYGRVNTNSLTVNLQVTNNYAYDLNGNLITNGNQVLDYDDENELIRVTVATSWKNEFVYDGKFRRRIERDFVWQSGAWLQTSETHFVYDGNVVIQERDTNNLPLVTYTRIGSSLLARTDNGLLNGGSSSAHAYYHKDGNANVAMMINASQAVVAKYLYDSFGNTLSMSGPLASANIYRFASKEWNANTGFYYFGRRYYDPNLQRFVNRDPIQEAGGLNLYGYVANNPINAIDLFGLQGFFEDFPNEDAWSGESAINSNPSIAAKVTGRILQLGDNVNAFDSENPIGEKFEWIAEQIYPTPAVIGFPHIVMNPNPSQEPVMSAAPDPNIITYSALPLPKEFTYIPTLPYAPTQTTTYVPTLPQTQPSNQPQSYPDSQPNPWIVLQKQFEPIVGVWQCSDSTGDYMKTQIGSPGPKWTLVRILNNQ